MSAVTHLPKDDHLIFQILIRINVNLRCESIKIINKTMIQKVFKLIFF